MDPVNGPAIDLDAWGEILSAYGDVSAAVAKAFAGPPPDLAALSALIRRRLDALRRRLPGGQEAAMPPLAFLLDEKILAQLDTTGLELTWPLLGRALADTDFGGDVFFHKADDLRAAAQPSALVIQVYLFCLDEGFAGRYADDPEALADYRKQLFAKLSAVPPPGSPATPPGLPVAPRPRWQFAVAAVGGVALWLTALWAVSARL
jgi:hypothetical protein